MPRTASPAIKPALPAQGAGRVKAKQPTQKLKTAADKFIPLESEALDCPLCIEPLDDTDRGFYPCSCGYQVCPFCYNKLLNEYNGLCPGCRTPYGQEPENLKRRVLFKQRNGEESSSQSVASRPSTASSAASAGVSQQPQPQQNINQQQQYDTSQVRPPFAQRRPPETPNARAVHQRDLESLPSLPSHATWGSGLAQQQYSEAESSAQPEQEQWPALGEMATQPGPLATRQPSSNIPMAVPPPPPPPPPPPYAQQYHSLSTPNHMDQQPRESSSAEGEASSSSCTPTAQVTSFVSGVRKSVMVPITLQSSVGPYPETQAMLSTFQQAVKEGTMTSKDAAQQLVAILRQRELQNGKVSLLQQGKVPPGFGPNEGGEAGLGASSANLSTPISTSPLDNEMNPIVPAPTNKCNPISPPTSAHGSYANLAGLTNSSTSNMVKNTVHAAHSGFSLWANHGLPRLDLVACSSGSTSSTVPPALHALWQSPNIVPGAGYDHVPNKTTAPLHPPPGFAGASSVRDMPSSSKNGYRPPMQAPAADYVQKYTPPEIAAARNGILVQQASASYRPLHLPGLSQIQQGLSSHSPESLEQGAARNHYYQQW